MFNKKAIEFNCGIVQDIINRNKEYVVFGGGSYFYSFIKKYCETGKFPYPTMIFDSNEAKWGKSIVDGLIISPPYRLEEVDMDRTVIAMGTNLPITVLNDLMEKYQRHYHMIILLKQIGAYFTVQNHGNDLESVCGLFEDDMSRESFVNVFNALLAGDFFHPMLYNSGQAYWNNDLIRDLAGKNVVYAGAFDGKHIDRALKVNSNGQIYAFEPNGSMFEKLVEKYKGTDRVHLFPYALYDKKCNLRFDPTHALGALVVEEEQVRMLGTEFTDIVEARAMDHVLQGKKIDLLALDVEGTEQRALMGAKKLISEHRPQLGICVYHRLEDYYMLPLYIKELNPDYKLYFRHHSTATIESVVYAL